MSKNICSCYFGRTIILENIIGDIRERTFGNFVCTKLRSVIWSFSATSVLEEGDQKGRSSPHNGNTVIKMPYFKTFYENIRLCRNDKYRVLQVLIIFHTA